MSRPNVVGHGRPRSAAVPWTTLLFALIEGAMLRRCKLVSVARRDAANSATTSPAGQDADRSRQNEILRVFLLPTSYSSCSITASLHAAHRFNNLSGSYSAPVTHRRCSSTASFRATATAAFFLAFFPPRAAIR